MGKEGNAINDIYEMICKLDFMHKTYKNKIDVSDMVEETTINGIKEYIWTFEKFMMDVTDRIDQYYREEQKGE